MVKQAYGVAKCTTVFTNVKPLFYCLQSAQATSYIPKAKTFLWGQKLAHRLHNTVASFNHICLFTNV